MENFDWQPNPTDPALAKVLSGDIISGNPSSRRVKERGHVCRHCGNITWRSFENGKNARADELNPGSCAFCDKPFGERIGLHRGWLDTQIMPNFNAKAEYLPQWHKPPSLQNERHVR